MNVPPERKDEILRAYHERLLTQYAIMEENMMDDVPLINLFETQVDYTPGNLALSFADETLTYQELNQRANQLAHTFGPLSLNPFRQNRPAGTACASCSAPPFRP